MAFVVTAITSVSALTAASSFIAIATAVAEVGMAMTVVGTVTKSKELVKVGGFLAMAGGVSSLAAGAFNAATGTAAAEGAGASLAAGSDAAFDAWAAEVGAAESGIGIEAFGGAAPSWAGSTGAAMEGMGAAQAGQEMTKIANATPTSPGMDLTSTTTDGVGGQALKFAENAGAIAPPAATDPGSMAQWWKNLPEPRKNAILQMGGKAVGGLFEGWTAEQKMAFERERLNLEQQKYNTGVSNANQQPTTIKPPSAGGLLNAKRG